MSSNLFFSVLISSILIALTHNVRAEPIPYPTVIVDPVIEESVEQNREVVGQVISRESGMISTDISGIIEEVYIQEGQFIQQHSMIAKLDQARLKLEFNLAEAKLQTAIANQKSAGIAVELAEKQLFRQKSLQNTPAFSKATYEDLENSLLNSKSIYAASQAESSEKQSDLSIAKLNLQRSIIRAPFSGLITQKLVHPGSYITPGTNIIELVNTEKLEISVDIPRNQFHAITENLIFSVVINSNNSDRKVLQAKFNRKILSENETSRTINIRLTPSEELLSNIIVNQSISTLIPTNLSKKYISVHKDALLIRHNNNYHVFIVEKNQAKNRPIKIGQFIGNRVEVLHGLQIGDQVVVRGNERLQQNQFVVPKPFKVQP